VNRLPSLDQLNYLGVFGIRDITTIETASKVSVPVLEVLREPEVESIQQPLIFIGEVPERTRLG
jgi:hypothetical protein